MPAKRFRESQGLVFGVELQTESGAIQLKKPRFDPVHIEPIAHPAHSRGESFAGTANLYDLLLPPMCLHSRAPVTATAGKMRSG
jgi:hypothetical protein